MAIEEVRDARRAVPRISEVVPTPTEPSYFYQQIDKLFTAADDRQLQTIIKLAQSEQTVRKVKSGAYGQPAQDAINSTIDRLDKMSEAVGTDMPKPIDNDSPDRRETYAKTTAENSTGSIVTRNILNVASGMSIGHLIGLRIQLNELIDKRQQEVRITQAIEDERRVTDAIQGNDRYPIPKFGQPSETQGKEYHRDEKSGALSGSKAIRMDLIPRSFLKLVADRFAFGTEIRKYPKNNWKQGITSPDYILERINHLILHAHKLVEPKRTDDEALALTPNATILDTFKANLGAIAWGCAFLAEALESEEGEKAILSILEF